MEASRWQEEERNAWILSKEAACVNRLEAGREGRNSESRVMGMEPKEHGRAAREERSRVSTSMAITTGNPGRRERSIYEGFTVEVTLDPGLEGRVGFHSIESFL